MKLHLTFPNSEEKLLTPCCWNDKDFILDGNIWDYICENLDGNIYNSTLREGYAVDRNSFWHIVFGSAIDNWIYFETADHIDSYQVENVTKALRELGGDNITHHVSVHYEDNHTVIIAKYYYMEE